MFKRGETKVPLDKIPAFAKALGVDAAHMFRLGMEQYWPESRATIEEAFGRGMATRNEADALLAKWRAATGNMDPEPTAKINQAVDKMLSELFKGSAGRAPGE
jgi:hypothetical protein